MKIIETKRGFMFGLGLMLGLGGVYLAGSHLYLAVASPSAAAEPTRFSAVGPVSRGPEDIPLNLHILVDQFGYRPQDAKVAVIRSPKIGFDADRPYQPGKRYAVRKVGDEALLHPAQAVAWNNGQVQESSGDVGWWYDFSGLREPGEYYVLDVERKQRSATFRIDQNVYRDVLRAAVRMFFYQRSGYAKREPFAEACWTDGAAYLGEGQDSEARDVSDRQNAKTQRNLEGGWFDAGDTNKYVTFSSGALHQLLTSYQDYPDAFSDDFNIPESGNGIPDLLDELRWHLQWLKKMQNPDGKVLAKVGAVVHATVSPPSADRAARYYLGPCTSSTIAAAAMFAHAAVVFEGIPALRIESQDLRDRAIRSFEAWRSAPKLETDCDQQIVKAGDADLDADTQKGYAALATIYLFAATDDPQYHQYFRENYRLMQPYKQPGWSRYEAPMGQALLFYTRLSGADPELRQKILEDKLGDARRDHGIYGTQGNDLYRNFMAAEQYHWGSNWVRANTGNTNMEMLRYQLDAQNARQYSTRALDSVHYFHGVNPFGMVYLSNMYALGATYSANEIFSAWFARGTPYANAQTSECGPAPGYLVGGPNRNAKKNGVPETLRPPVGQPPQKSYRDWNRAWPDAAYSITEPANIYQAAYVQLLAGFVGAGRESVVD